jgi:hypothetical protein
MGGFFVNCDDAILRCGCIKRWGRRGVDQSDIEEGLPALGHLSIAS